jgi:hypothetical protein
MVPHFPLAGMQTHSHHKALYGTTNLYDETQLTG